MTKSRKKPAPPKTQIEQPDSPLVPISNLEKFELENKPRICRLLMSKNQIHKTQSK